MKPIDKDDFSIALGQINSAATVQCLVLIKQKLDQIVMVLNDHTDRLDEMEDTELNGDDSDEAVTEDDRT